MIIFANERIPLNYITSLYGHDNIIYYNFVSNLELGIRLNNIIPSPFPIEWMTNEEAQMNMDSTYINYLYCNNYAFTDIMSIMCPIFNDHNKVAYILYNPNNMYLEIFKESVSKYILERYGYVINFVNDPEDLYSLKKGTFYKQGLINMDIDNERYILLLSEGGVYYDS